MLEIQIGKGLLVIIAICLFNVSLTASNSSVSPFNKKSKDKGYAYK
jgi:hypothetical protein